jgi:hypothetical protein
MKNREFSECEFAADMVPYMYGELSPSENTVFESHLLDCGGCTDEFAAMANARYEVYDWKKTSFDPLPTPRFAIELEDPHRISAGVSWVERLRAVFANGWAVPTVAFAAVALVSVMTGVVLVSRDRGDVAAVEQVPVPTASSPAPANEIVPTSTDLSTGEADNKIDDDEVAPAPTDVAPKRKVPGRVHRTPRPVPVVPTETRATRTETINVPRLNDFTEEEDTSLRLAELFEDVGSSE